MQVNAATRDVVFAVDLCLLLVMWRLLVEFFMVSGLLRLIEVKPVNTC